jgi:hypothetical protein
MLMVCYPRAEFICHTVRDGYVPMQDTNCKAAKEIVIHVLNLIHHRN